MNIFKEKSTRRMRKIPEDLVLKPEVEVFIQKVRSSAQKGLSAIPFAHDRIF